MYSELPSDSEEDNPFLNFAEFSKSSNNDMSLSKKDVETLLEAAIALLRTQNSALQNEITSLKSQLGTGIDLREAKRTQRATVLREEREAAEQRVRERLQQGNINVDNDEDIGL